jgi:hypothetical protein
VKTSAPSVTLKESAWRAVDWDGLAVGDEAEDYATLAWPFDYRQGEDWRELLGGPKDASLAARIELHLRAITLDCVIDVLADCDVAEWREQVRRRKETEHHGYYDWYRGRWG